MKTKEIIQRIVAVSFCIFMCSLCLMITASAQAKEISLGNGITASLSETGTLTVKGSGKMPDQTASSGDKSHPFYEIREDIYNVVIEDGITRIGDYSFSNLPNMQNLTIGSSVTEIGNQAFSGCWAPLFTSVTIPSNVQVIEERAFYDCDHLSALSLNTGLKKIGTEAFYSCDDLKRIDIPNGVNVVEESAFADCNKDMVITISKDITTIKAGAFSNGHYYSTGSSFWGYKRVYDGTISVTVYSEDVLLGNDCFKSKNTNIKCYRGSTAEKYAGQYDYASAEYLGVESKLYFDANGGFCKKTSMSVTSEYYYGKLPVPVRDGYSFQGWFTKRKGGTQIKKGDLITQTSDMTVYAKWKKVSVKVAKIQKLTNLSGRKLVVDIKKVSGASGYEVQYATKKNMINAKIKRKKGTRITIRSLQKRRTYYVRARAYITDANGAKIYGKWGSVKKIKIRR